MDVVPFAEPHLQGILALCRAEGWPSLPSDSNRALGALTAPGVICVVALHDAEVVGFLQMLTDGTITGYISVMAVAAAHRRKGVGRQLIEAAFTRSALEHLDLLAGEDAAAFYRSFQHRSLTGIRIYPDSTSVPATDK